MALWGDKDDIFSSGTVSIKLAGVGTFYADGQLVSTGKTGFNAASGSVYEVIGSIGAGAELVSVKVSGLLRPETY